MRALQTFVLLILAASVHSAIAQNPVVVDHRLPPASIELKSKDRPVTATPWQLPKPGDPFYDAEQEVLTKDSEHTHVVHVFKYGVFVGYDTITSGSATKEVSTKTHSEFIPNDKLPADAIELAPKPKADKAEYFESRPDKRPANIPESCIPVKVFQEGKLVGWTFMDKRAVEVLHQSEGH